MTLVWEDFAYYDNSNFTLDILKGRNYPTPIWQGQGRFFPLGYQEFNLLRHFTDTITGYHVLPIAQLLIFSWILLILDDELSIAARVALTILALVTPSILISFSGLIFPSVMFCPSSPVSCCRLGASNRPNLSRGRWPRWFVLRSSCITKSPHSCFSWASRQ